MRVLAAAIVLCAVSTQCRAAESFTLSNGLKVILRPVQGAETAAILVVFDIGGNHDPAGKSGLAHFLEHVYFTTAAGSRKSRTADEWMLAGGNAQTLEESTIFGETFPKSEIESRIQD